MPVVYSIDHNILRLDLIGVYTPDDVVKAIGESLSDPALHGRAHLLVDVSRSESIHNRSNEEIQQFVRQFVKQTEAFGRKRAIVVQSRLQYGLMRMAAAWGEEHDLSVRVFMADTEAVRWLSEEFSD